MGTVVVGEVVADRYELEELVGTGGMSSVYRAHDRLLERTVALKILHEQFSSDDDYVERFRREARSAARLVHPGIVTVIDRGEQDGRQFIVFEHVEGETLKDVIDREGPLPVRRAIELTLQIARALQFAHAQGLVHRDVKPQNVLLNGDGRAKVTDFGIAREVDVEHGFTQTGTVLGTSHYLAPEQAKGEKVDAQSDVYALGAVLYELLTGEVPFPGDSFVAVAMKHVTDDAPSVLELRPDVPPRVAAAVARALQKDPAERFPSMRDFARVLEACIDEPDDAAAQTMIVRDAVPAFERKPPDRPRPTRSRRRLWPLGPLAVLLIAAGAIAAGVLLSHTSSSSPPPGPPVVLSAVTSFDPSPGDGTERDELIPNATDGDPATAWETEHYATPEFGNLKSGVGIVLDAGHAVRLSTLTVATDDPGYSAVVKAGASPSGPFQPVSTTQTVGAHTTFTLDVPSPTQYYLLWITHLAPDGRAAVSEVTAH